MADENLCSIAWCHKPKADDTYCKSHLKCLLKTGSPTRTPRGNVHKFVSDLKRGVEQCIEWPFSYGMFGYPRYSGSKYGTKMATRVICIMHNGPPPEGMEAAHECGNKRCVNPDHIFWKTRLENNHDKFRHGTMMRGETHYHAILKDDDIPKIRQMRKDGMSNVSIARLYGVSHVTVSHVCHYRSWRHIT